VRLAYGYAQYDYAHSGNFLSPSARSLHSRCRAVAVRCRAWLSLRRVAGVRAPGPAGSRLAEERRLGRPL